MVKIEQSWYNALSSEFDKSYFTQLTERVRKAYATTRIYPKGGDIFRAFDLCPLPQVKVVILGQDPYHQPGQAHGLSFSVPQGVALPPSLRNIYTELSADLEAPAPTHGDLTHWAEQGVLLLNATLTVEDSSPNSHSTWGWQLFTDKVIRIVNEECEHVVFILWGSYAQSKRMSIDEGRHFVLTAPHPSPLSAHRGFFGCRHFSQTNYYLIAHGKQPIRWLP